MKTPLSHLKTGKQRIFVAFFLYSMVSLGVSVVSFSLFRQLEDLERVTEGINQFYVNTLRGIKTGQDFFVHEVTNDEFYQFGRSGILNEHHRLFKDVNEQRKTLLQEKKMIKLVGNEPLKVLDSLIEDYLTTFHGIVIKIKTKGFKQFGLVGQMREYAHKLEDYPLIDRVNLLQIRRLEKDYLLRQDTSYMYRLIDESSELRNHIRNHPAISASDKDDLRYWLSRYDDLFLEIVQLDLEVGQKDRTGLSQQLYLRSQRINEIVRDFNAQATARYKQIFQNFQIVTVVVVTISVILTLLLSLGFKHVISVEE